MSTRPQLQAERREVLGKKVAHLRRDGYLPAVVYGHGVASDPIQLDMRRFLELRRHAGRNALVDLKVDGSRPQPVLLHAVQEHPVTRRPLHADFLVVRMTEEMTVDVPVTHVGESAAVERMGGTLLHLRDTIAVRALPADLPSALELDVTPLDTFDVVLHVGDLRVPDRVTIVTEPSEPLARVQQPRLEVEAVLAPEAEAEAEAAPEAEAEAAPEGEAGAERAPTEGGAKERAES